MARFRIQIALLAAAAAGLLPALLGATATAQAASAGQAAPRAFHMRAVKVGTFSLAGLGSAPVRQGQDVGPPHQPMNKTLRHPTAAQGPPGHARWVLSLLEFPVDPSTGAFGNPALQDVAVPQPADPAGTWNIYSSPTTHDGTAGTPSDPGCPCFGDQPLLGADANGIYVTT